MEGFGSPGVIVGRTDGSVEAFNSIQGLEFLQVGETMEEEEFGTETTGDQQGEPSLFVSPFKKNSRVGQEYNKTEDHEEALSQMDAELDRIDDVLGRMAEMKSQVSPSKGSNEEKRLAMTEREEERNRVEQMMQHEAALEAYTRTAGATGIRVFNIAEPYPSKTEGIRHNRIRTYGSTRRLWTAEEEGAEDMRLLSQDQALGIMKRVEAGAVPPYIPVTISTMGCFTLADKSCFEVSDACLSRILIFEWLTFFSRIVS